MITVDGYSKDPNIIEIRPQYETKKAAEILYAYWCFNRYCRR